MMARAPRYEEFLDAEWLRTRYVDEGLSTDQIAELIGFDVKPASVGYWLAKHGIPLRPKSSKSPAGRPRRGRPHDIRWDSSQKGAW